MSKLNSTNKSAMPDGERLAGGFGALAAEISGWSEHFLTFIA